MSARSASTTSAVVRLALAAALAAACDPASESPGDTDAAAAVDAASPAHDAGAPDDASTDVDASSDVDASTDVDAGESALDGGPAPRGAPVWVGVGNWGYRSSTRDGRTWQTRLNPAQDNDHTPDLLRAVGFGDGVFIVVGGDRNSMIMRSEDGVLWAEDLHPSGRQWLGAVAYLDGRWLAAGGVGTAVTSVDGGRTWTDAARAPSAVRGLAAGAGRFVAVGDGAMIATTVDGSEWQNRSRPGSLRFDHVAHHAGTWVVAGSEWNGSSFDTECWTSRDTESWTACPFSIGRIRAVLSTDGRLVVIHADGYEHTSDGTTWQHSSAQIPTALGADGHFVGVDGARRYTGSDLESLERVDDGERSFRAFTMGWVAE